MPRVDWNNLAAYLTYLAVRLAAMFVHMFPVDAYYPLCRRIGDLLFRLNRRHRHRAVEHLRRSFPDWSEDRLRAVARASMRNMIYLGLEFLFTPRMVAPGTWRRRIRLVGMAESVRLMLRRDSGMVLLTGHFGNWEVVGYAIAMLGFPTVSVARRLDNPYLDRYVIGMRERAGQRILDKNGASAVVPDLLGNHGVACFIADQDAGRKGAFVDFFGRKASTYKMIALMAMQHQTPVVVGYGRRLGERYEFEIGIQRVIHPQEWSAQADPLLWITQEYTTALEQAIRLAPEQYLWSYRRWKNRPKGEPETADGIA